MFDDLHVFDPVACTWTELNVFAGVSGTPPTARGGHGFAQSGGQLYVHGGQGYYDTLDDLYVYDPVNMSWTDLSNRLAGNAPSARNSHGFTSMGGRLFVHAGWDGNGKRNRILQRS